MTARPAASQRRSQQERSRTTRSALLGAAVQRIRESGYAGTTTSDVARAANVTRGAVQHHFKDRNDLMASVVKCGWEDLVGRLRGISAIEGSLRDRVDAVVDRMWESYSSDAARAAFAIVFATRGDAEQEPIHQELFDRTRHVLDEEWQRVFDGAPAHPERIRLCRRFARSALAGMIQQFVLDTASAERVPDDLKFVKEAAFRMLSSEELD